MSKLSTDGIGALWEGAFGTMGATWLGHYPWCVIMPAAACSALCRTEQPAAAPRGRSPVLCTLGGGLATASSVEKFASLIISAVPILLIFQVCDVQFAECRHPGHLHWRREAHSQCVDRVLRLLCLGLRVELNSCDYHRENGVCDDCRLRCYGKQQCVSPLPASAGPAPWRPAAMLSTHKPHVHTTRIAASMWCMNARFPSGAACSFATY